MTTTKYANEIKVEFINHLQAELGDELTFVAHEVPYLFGERFIDIVYMHNDSLYCVEIKSAKDSIEKLNSQLEDMTSISDYSIALIDNTHLTNTRKSIPTRAGIISLDDDTFVTRRSAKRVSRKDKMHLCSLLNKNRLQKALGVSYKTNTDKLREMAVSTLSTEEILKEVKDHLMEKYQSAYKQLCQEVKPTHNTSNDLKILSYPSRSVRCVRSASECEY